ncbi:alpha/beta fold hydrolase [Acidimicrobiia bacterium EGI L10123]|uniref:alpha/beta fold hydrolase n=1 Tax=Salinilacustrithrix flava TaxID=2957203 RepID=UPI003D7C1A07|nr:alpha/beta fold hydrolase [Acidimicrobiia bacterium EGI L10123]
MSAPVVLVHGFGTSYELTWVHNGWVDLLADEGREVIGVDLLGHGNAPKPTDPEAYDDLGARVRDALPDEPVDAIGFSLGAKTLLQVAAADPSRFRSLIVAGVGSNLFQRSDHSAVVEAVRTGDDGGDPALRYFAGLADLPGNDREALAACMSNGGGGVTPEQLAAITCPVLVVLGDQDFTRPATPLVEALPDATYVELARTDHAKTPKSFAFIDAALEFLRAR